MKPPERLKAVLFDLDGVLIDSFQAWFRLLNAARVHFDYTPITQSEFEQIWGQAAAADRDGFFERQSVEEIETFYSEHFRDFMDHVEVQEGVEEVFSLLEDHGIGSAVVTNTANPLATELVQFAGARPQVIVGGNDVAQPKPAPDMLSKALKELSVDASFAYMVGDSSYDKRAAAAAKVPFIGVGIAAPAVIQNVRDLVPILRRPDSAQRTP